MGHTLTLLTSGAILVLLQADMPPVAAQLLELCVVLLLVGFGVRAIYQGACRVSARPTHSHGRARAFSPFGMDRWTVARPLLVGAVHGLAGSGAMTALVVTTLPSTETQLAYLLLFGVGSTLGMAALSGVLGWPLACAGSNRVLCGRFHWPSDAFRPPLGLLWGYPLVGRLF